MTTQIRLLQEQSDLGLHCLTKKLLKHFSRQKRDGICCDWSFKGQLYVIFQHTDAVKVLDKDETITKRDTSVFLRQTVSQLENISNLDNTTAKQMLETTVRQVLHS